MIGPPRGPHTNRRASRTSAVISVASSWKNVKISWTGDVFKTSIQPTSPFSIAFSDKQFGRFVARLSPGTSRVVIHGNKLLWISGFSKFSSEKNGPPRSRHEAESSIRCFFVKFQSFTRKGRKDTSSRMIIQDDHPLESLIFMNTYEYLIYTYIYVLYT